MGWRRWLLVSASATATAALAVASADQSAVGLKHLVQELVAEGYQHDAVHELANEKNQWASAQRGAYAAYSATQHHSPPSTNTAASGDDDSLAESSPVDYENQQLHKMLAFANRYEQKLEGQLKKVPLLQGEVASDKERDQKLHEQLDKATSSAAQYKLELDSVSLRFRALQRNNSDALGDLRNMTAATRVLQGDLLNSSRSRHELEVALRATTKGLRNSGGTRHAFEKLRLDVKHAEERAVKEDRSVKSERAATQTALHSLAQLQHELNNTEHKLEDEVARESRLNKTSDSLAKQSEAERMEVSKGAERLQQSAAANQRLGKEVAFLKRRVADGDRARKHAEETAAETDHAMARANAEIQQLKGSVPWLEAKVAADQRELKKAVSETQAANEARDVATAMADEAKGKIVHLEQQYAGVVQSLARQEGAEEGNAAAMNPAAAEVDPAAADVEPQPLTVTAASPPPNLGDVASWTSEADFANRADVAAWSSDSESSPSSDEAADADA